MCILVCMSVCGYVHSSWCLLRTEENATSPEAEPTGSCKRQTWMLGNELEGSIGAANGSDC